MANNISIPSVPNQLKALNKTPGQSPDEKFYAVKPEQWYQALPYRFRLVKNAGTVITINLPISPNNLQVNTRMGSIVTPSLYGIIEQHSEVRLYDILIQGTTGMAPQFVGMTSEGGAPDSLNGRSSFTPDESPISKIGNYLPEVTNMVKQAKKIYSEITSDPNSNKNPSGISVLNTGYYAFHQLYKFFLEYKDECVNGLSDGSEAQPQGLANQAKNAISKLAGKSAKQSAKSAKTRSAHPLQFINFKDNMMYDVVPVAFTLTRSAENPMLYNYSIKLIAFNLQSANGKALNNSFDSTLKAKLGLGGLQGDTFANFANKARTVATVLSRVGIGK